MADWKASASAHRQKQLDAIPPEWRLTQQQIRELGGSGTKDSGRLIKLQVVRKAGILSERELDITENYTATQLRDQIALGQVKSVDVTVALAKRAALAQQFVSSLVRTPTRCMAVDVKTTNGPIDKLFDGNLLRRGH